MKLTYKTQLTLLLVLLTVLVFIAGMLAGVIGTMRFVAGA